LIGGSVPWLTICFALLATHRCRVGIGLNSMTLQAFGFSSFEFWSLTLITARSPT
jgi:hypothetical protein